MKRTIGIIECNYPAATNGSITDVRPAASFPFHGRYRLVDFPLSNMVNSGVEAIGLILPTNYRSIIDHVGAGKEWGLARKRGGLFPTPGSVFGTARRGGRFLVRDIISTKAMFERADYDYVVFSTANFVMNVDFDEVLDSHIAAGADITMVTKTCPAGRSDANTVGLTMKDGKVSGTFYGVKEGDLAFLDAFIINRETLDKVLVRYENYDYLDLFEAMAKGDFGRVNVNLYEFNGYVAPVFNRKTYYRVSMDMLNPKLAADVFPVDRFIKTKSHDTAPAKYQAGCDVSKSLVSSSCIISGEVKGSVLGRHVVVEPGASVIDSVVMQGVTIKSGARVENAIIDRNNTIAAGTQLVGTKDSIFYLGKSDVYRAGTDD